MRYTTGLLILLTLLICGLLITANSQLCSRHPLPTRIS